ncbi:hypothetical protein EYR36_006178 [Pleurotus pulmonarius]|nr:hypothetical protein EYR36_006178 [Pleurotus pulmonarius]
MQTYSPPSRLSDSWKAAGKNNPFVALWHEWWNKEDKKGSLVAGQVVTSTVMAPWYLRNTEGQFYVRAYYERIYLALENQVAKKVVLTGQPGTGKTYGLLFLLLKKLVKGEPVIFMPSTRGALYFSSSGVQSNKSLDSFEDFAVFNQDIPPGNPLSSTFQPQVWALVNSDSGDGGPPPVCLTASPLVVVQATSPCLSRYKGWIKEKGGDVWLALFPPLSKLSLDGELRARLDKAILKWGSAPRDLTLALTNEQKLEQQLTAALSAVRSSSQLLIQFHDAAVNDSGVPCIITSVYGSCAKENVPIVDFKSPYICHRVQQSFDDVPREVGVQAIHRHCQENNQGRLLLGWAFDRLVINTICGSRPNLDTYPPIPAVCTSSSDWSLKNTSDALSATRSSLWSISTFADICRQAYGRASSVGLQRIPFGLQSVRFDKTLSNVSLDETKLFLPSQPHFPLLDAFYLLLNHKRRRVTVVVLQMTIYATHKGSPDGYPFLQRLKDHLRALQVERRDIMGRRQKHQYDVSFAYLLVVPSFSLKYQFTWSFPKKFPDAIAGPVYIQVVRSELRVSAEEDESFFVEDV